MKMTQENKSNNLSSVNKENFGTGKNTSLQPLSKAIIDKNNTIILIEINRFRLMFKIYEKLKKIAPEEKNLHSILGDDILQRVTNVADIILSSRDESSKKKAERFNDDEAVKNVVIFSKIKESLDSGKWIRHEEWTNAEIA